MRPAPRSREAVVTAGGEQLPGRGRTARRPTGSRLHAARFAAWGGRFRGWPRRPDDGVVPILAGQEGGFSFCPRQFSSLSERRAPSWCHSRPSVSQGAKQPSWFSHGLPLPLNQRRKLGTSSALRPWRGEEGTTVLADGRLPPEKEGWKSYRLGLWNVLRFTAVQNSMQLPQKN